MKTVGLKQTEWIRLGSRRVPVIGVIDAGGRVTLADTPLARRLAGPRPGAFKNRCRTGD